MPDSRDDRGNITVDRASLGNLGRRGPGDVWPAAQFAMWEHELAHEDYYDWFLTEVTRGRR